jgi:hypothetical protein
MAGETHARRYHSVTMGEALKQKATLNFQDSQCFQWCRRGDLNPHDVTIAGF